MNKIELKKKNWDQISITDYKKIVEINNRELDSPLEKDIACLSIMCDVPEEDLYNMPLPDLRMLMAEMEWIKKPFTFNHTFNTKKLKIDGVEYVVEADLDKFTVAQYMDYQNFWDKRNDHMGNLLAVFIVPKGHKYNEGYDIMELAKKLEDTLSIRFWNEVCFFFLHNWWVSVKASIVYSLWLTRKEIRRTKDKEAKKTLKEKEKELTEKLKQVLPIG